MNKMFVSDEKINDIVSTIQDTGRDDFVRVGEQVREIYETEFSSMNDKMEKMRQAGEGMRRIISRSVGLDAMSATQAWDDVMHK